MPGCPIRRRPATLCDHDLLTVAADVAERADADKIEEALALERAVRAADVRIENSDGSRVNDVLATTALVNTRGFRGVRQGTRAARSTGPGRARRRDQTDRPPRQRRARLRQALEPVPSVALHAVHRALALLGARKPATMRVPVIFERDVAAGVLKDVFAALNASNVALGNSWLAERAGERIGSERVTLIDDGLLRGGLGSSPFDAEGTPSRETVALRAGVLETYLSDVYWGRRLGIASTGNAAGDGVAANNFYLAPEAARSTNWSPPRRAGCWCSTRSASPPSTPAASTAAARAASTSRTANRATPSTSSPSPRASPRCWPESTRSPATCASTIRSSHHRSASPR